MLLHYLCHISLWYLKNVKTLTTTLTFTLSFYFSSYSYSHLILILLLFIFLHLCTSSFIILWSTMSPNSSTRKNVTSNCLCYYCRRATIRTTRTAKNNGRLSYVCPLRQVSNVNGVFCILIFVQDWTWVFCVVQQDADRCNFFSWVDEDIDVGATEISKIEQIPNFGLRLILKILQREVKVLTFRGKRWSPKLCYFSSFNVNLVSPYVAVEETDVKVPRVRPDDT